MNPPFVPFSCRACHLAPWSPSHRFPFLVATCRCLEELCAGRKRSKFHSDFSSNERKFFSFFFQLFLKTSSFFRTRFWFVTFAAHCHPPFLSRLLPSFPTPYPLSGPLSRYSIVSCVVLITRDLLLLVFPHSTCSSLFIPQCLLQSCVAYTSCAVAEHFQSSREGVARNMYHTVRRGKERTERGRRRCRVMTTLTLCTPLMRSRPSFCFSLHCVTSR